jgi:hypothetical protein
MQIFGSEGHFSFNSIGEKTGQSYMGDFKVKCIISPMDFIEIDKMYRGLLGNNMQFAEQHARQIAFTFSQLHFRVIEAPEWYIEGQIKGKTIKDDNVLFELLNTCLDCEEKYVTQKKKEQEELQKKLTQSIKKNKIKKEEEEIEVNE